MPYLAYPTNPVEHDSCGYLKPLTNYTSFLMFGDA